MSRRENFLKIASEVEIVSIKFLTNERSWRDFERIACICTLIISTGSLILICLIVTRRCAEIILAGEGSSLHKSC